MHGLTPEQSFGIILSLQDEDFLSDLRLAAALTKGIAKQMKQDATIKLDYTGEDLASTMVTLKQRLAEVNSEISNTKDPEQLKSLNKEAEELNEVIQFITENYKRFLAEGEKTPKKIDVNLKASIRQVTKLALGLVGIRSIWGALSRAANTYMNDNKVINQQLRITFNILSQAIGPVIKTLINIVEYGAIVLARLIQGLTGANILEKAQAATLKDLAKQAKKAQSALAGFDTISNMSDNADAMEDYNAALSAYNDFVDKIGEVEDIWEKWGPAIEEATIALSALWGAKTLIGLGKLIGTASTAGTTGSGLLGITSLLKTLGTYALITISIYAIIKGYQRFMQVKAFMDKYDKKEITKRQNSVKGIGDAIDYISETTDDVKENAAQIGDNYNLWNEFIGDITGQHKEALKTSKDIIVANDEIVNKVEKILANEELTTEEAQDLLDALVEQYQVNTDIETQLMFQGKDTTDIKNSQEKLLGTVSKVKDQYKVSNEYVWSTYDGVKETDHIKVKDKSFKLNVDADTSKAEKSLHEFLTKFFNSGMGNIPVFSSIKDLFSGYFQSYDVGTNYVPSDQVAVVHKGEMIVPAKYNPMTSGIGGSNEETNELLRQLNTTLEQKQFNGYISASDITNTAINGINQQSRIMGRSVIK